MDIELFIDTALFMVLIWLVIILVIAAKSNFRISGEEAVKKSLSLPVLPVKYLGDKLKPSTPIQKEIKAEQKEIARLEKHKADMKELERLKEQREKLFEETRKFKGVDPVPYLKAAEQMYSAEETDAFIYESMTASISQCPECETENIASAISYGVLLDRYHNTCLDCNHKWMAETKNTGGQII